MKKLNKTKSAELWRTLLNPSAIKHGALFKYPNGKVIWEIRILRKRWVHALGRNGWRCVSRRTLEQCHFLTEKEKLIWTLRNYGWPNRFYKYTKEELKNACRELLKNPGIPDIRR